MGSDIDIASAFAFEDENRPDIEKLKTEINGLPTLMKVDISNIVNLKTRFSNRVRETGGVLYSASQKFRAEDGSFFLTYIKP